MTEVRIGTPRGKTLVGQFVKPVDATDAVVVFSASFLGEQRRGSVEHRMGAAYRAGGYATMTFDYSGCGASDDDALEVRHHVEDLRAVCNWLADQGLGRQLLHAHSFGTIPAVLAAPEWVETMVLTGLVAGPMDFQWEHIFSPDQLDQLQRLGHTLLPNDSGGPRTSYTITKQTLQDLLLNRAEDLFADLDVPVLVVHDDDDQNMGLVEMTREAWPLLPAGSQLQCVDEVRFARDEGLELLRNLALDWAKRHVPVRPS